MKLRITIDADLDEEYMDRYKSYREGMMPRGAAFVKSVLLDNDAGRTVFQDRNVTSALMPTNITVEEVLP